MRALLTKTQMFSTAVLQLPVDVSEQTSMGLGISGHICRAVNQ